MYELSSSFLLYELCGGVRGLASLDPTWLPPRYLSARAARSFSSRLFLFMVQALPYLAAHAVLLRAFMTLFSCLLNWLRGGAGLFT